MGIEVPNEGTTEKIKPASAEASAGKEEKVRPKKVRKIEIELKKIDEDKKEEPEMKESEVKKDEKPSIEIKEKWLEPEGQLAVDVYQTELDLVIQSAIAGIEPEDLDISIEGDNLTIIGERHKTFEEAGDYFTQECYWGRFSRQLILPVEVDPNKIEAALKNGILTIRLPKIQREKKRKVVVKG